MNKKTAKILAVALLFFSGSGCTLPYQNISLNSSKSVEKINYTETIYIEDQKLNVKTVTSPADMEQGLSGQEKLLENQGMLFKFTTPGKKTFWMKDMKFNLDIIWIRDKKIIGITENISMPEKNTQIKNLPLYTPPSEIDAALEINSGWSKLHKIKTGDRLRFSD